MRMTFEMLHDICGVIADKNGCIPFKSESERSQAASDYILDDAIEYVVEVWPELMDEPDDIENEELRSTLADVYSIAWWCGYENVSDEITAAWLFQALEGRFHDQRDDLMLAMRAGHTNGKEERGHA